MTIEITPDRTLVRPSGGSVRYLLCELSAPLREESAPRKPLNVALVIDRSGSMAGAKMVQARGAATYALGLLQPEDRIAVVAYDDVVDVIVPSTKVSRETMMRATRRIAQLHERGNTDLCAGWLTGCREIADNLLPGAITRCLLLTDGLANHGITSKSEIVAHARALHARGVATSTFGIGEDFDEVLLAGMAQAGGGAFRLVRDADEIPRLVREELKESLDVVIARAQLEIVGPPGIRITSLNDFPVVQAANGATCVELGDLVSGQLLMPVLRVEFQGGTLGDRLALSVVLRDGEGRRFETSNAVTFMHASDDAVDLQPRDQRVDREVATQYAARARREALSLNRDRNYDGAASVIDACIEHIRDYAGDDVEILAVIDDLTSEKTRAVRHMASSVRKMSYAASYQTSTLRTSSGATLSKYLRNGADIVVVPFDDVTAEAAERAVRALRPSTPLLLGNLRVSTSWRGFERQDTAAAELEPLGELHLIDTARERWRNAGIILVLTPARFADNWFSHWHAAGRTGVASLHALSDVVGVDRAAYLAYEMLLNGLNNASHRYDLVRMAHEDTRGCLFDFCRDKRDMEIKLQSMHVCPDCESRIAALGIDLEPMREATDAIRDLAFGGGMASGDLAGMAGHL